MITTELDRYEFTVANTDPVVFRSGGTDIPIRDTAHVKVYVTTTGVFTVDTGNDELDDTAHGHLLNEQITLSAATTMPTGLLANTIYYVVNPTLNTNNSFQVALSASGTPITITTTGSGTLTWTKTLLKVITTNYTVALVGTTATITWVTAPAVSDKVLFLRDVTFEQTTDLQNNSQFEAESVEGQLDLMVNMSQQLKNTSDRQLKFSNTLIASDATEAAATLTATSAGRADKGLRFDSLGNLGVTTIDIDLAQDYILEAKSWATEDGIVQTYDGTVASNVSPTEYSSKDYAQGDAPGGSSKEWAQTVDVAIDTTFSAKEYAQGDGNSDALTTGGSAKGWSQDTAKVNGATTNDRSAKAWSQGTSMTGSTLGGSSKDWAQKTDGAVNTTFSAKEYAHGTTGSTGGSAKDYAQKVDGGVSGATSDHSAKAWSVGGTGVTDTTTKGASKQWAIDTEFTFANTAINTSTDVIDKGSAHGLSTDTRVKVNSNALMPLLTSTDRLSPTTIYYFESVSSNTFKLHTSAGASSLVNFSNQGGSGTLTLATQVDSNSSDGEWSAKYYSGAAEANAIIAEQVVASNITVSEIASATLITFSETFADTDDTKIPTVRAVIDNTATTGKAIAMAIVFGG